MTAPTHRMDLSWHENQIADLRDQVALLQEDNRRLSAQIEFAEESLLRQVAVWLRDRGQGVAAKKIDPRGDDSFRKNPPNMNKDNNT